MEQPWDYFTVNTTDIANPTWPVVTAGVPPGMGGSTVSATAPSGLLAPVGSLIVLRGVFSLGITPQQIELRHADGTTVYLDGGIILTSSATNPINSLGQAPIALPLWNGLCAISKNNVAGRVLIAYNRIK